MKFSKICIVAILCLCLMVGSVSAADNETVDAPPILENETVDSPQILENESVDDTPTIVENETVDDNSTIVENDIPVINPYDNPPVEIPDNWDGSPIQDSENPYLFYRFNDFEGWMTYEIFWENTEDYENEYNYWIQYYRSLKPSEEEQKRQIYAYLTDESVSENERFDNVLRYIGYSDELTSFLDESKRTIDVHTGVVTYNLGIGNWFNSLFGNGIDESKLPQNVAQGNALCDAYKERYEWYLTVEWGLIFDEDE